MKWPWKKPEPLSAPLTVTGLPAQRLPADIDPGKDSLPVLSLAEYGQNGEEIFQAGGLPEYCDQFQNAKYSIPFIARSYQVSTAFVASTFRKYNITAEFGGGYKLKHWYRALVTELLLDKTRKGNRGTTWSRRGWRDE